VDGLTLGAGAGAGGVGGGVKTACAGARAGGDGDRMVSVMVVVSLRCHSFSQPPPSCLVPVVYYNDIVSTTVRRKLRNVKIK
jgi:hypothetical protein